jgi:salicylate hydroxylase
MPLGKKTLRILVIGAGIGGLTTAIALRKAGHIVTILEQSLIEKEVGAALTISPNATRVLISLGLDLQKARTVPWDWNRVLLVDESSTSELSKLNVKVIACKYGSPCVSSHRVDLHEALMALALSEDSPRIPINLITGARALSVDPVAGSVTVEDGSVYSADLIIGADGVHSLARRFAAGFDSPPRPSKTTVMRFTVASDTIRNDPVMAPLLEGGENTLRCYLIPSDDTRYLLQYPCRK